MGKYKKLPVEIEAISFDEFVQYGLNAEGANIVDGQPWHFDYKGHPVTQENATLYLIPTKEGVFHFTPSDVLITGVQGEVYPCKKDIFLATYEKSDKENLTYGEAEKLMLAGDTIALPEWGGFWFKRTDIDTIFVLLSDGTIVETPDEKYKERNDWKVITPNTEQDKIISEYFISKKELTFGQKLVGLSFNPSGDDRVGNVKQLFADAIDVIGDPFVDDEKRSYSYNIIRTTAINTCWAAQMAVVKFLTWRD
jgi:hypothetical protein